MKKIDFTEETSGLILKEKRRRSQSKGPKKATKASSENNNCYFRKQSGHMKKNYLKYKETQKKKGGSEANGASTRGKQSNQAGVAKEVVEKPCDALLVNQGRGKGRFLLDSGCTYQMCPRKE